MSEKKIPNPGSDEAIAMGCKCPILDNSHGRGFPGPEGKPVFWISQVCPLHNAEYNKICEDLDKEVA